MPSKVPADPPPSEITDETVWRQRRRFLKAAFAAGVGSGLGGLSGVAGSMSDLPDPQPRGAPVDRSDSRPTAREMLGVKKTSIGAGQTATDFEYFTSYNNFYEFGTDKSDPAKHAHRLQTRPWTVKIDGECERPVELGIEDLLSGFDQEERIYRLRCVEAWAMVVPWIGFPLGDLLKRVKPTSRARFVAFETLFDPEQMPGQQRRILDWPYREGLRIDEAMHPLALISTGAYGKELLGQNGAPLRLVVPWKYGFKSIKSIVRITLVENLPPTTWWQLQPSEYGFYANVNPEVDHPRWSQRQHRMIGEGVFAAKRDTLMFNGYAEQVADLYRGMDLRRQF
jgi:sulfoxide reductase catalytic subunit YedY